MNVFFVILLAIWGAWVLWGIQAAGATALFIAGTITFLWIMSHA